MQKYGYIYLTRNNINGKMYVGQKKSFEFIESYHGSGKLLQKAINKYGIDNFSTELIEWCYSREELDMKEIYWIGYFDAVTSDLFYNLQAGGQTGNIAGSKLSDETRRKLSIAQRKRTDHKPLSEETKKLISDKLKIYHAENPGVLCGPNNPMYGKHKSEEQKKYLSDKFSGEGNPFYGHKHSDESRAKISESRMGTNNPASGKKWIMKDTSTKRVLESDLQIYLNDGWVLGRYVSQETRNKHRENTKNRRDNLGRFKKLQ